MEPTPATERPQKAAGGPPKRREGHGAKTAAVREQAILALLSERTIGGLTRLSTPEPAEPPPIPVPANNRAWDHPSCVRTSAPSVR
jgi:hypothetical protein